MSVHITRKDINHPYFRDLKRHHHINTGLTCALYAFLVLAVLLPLAILHLHRRTNSRPPSSRSRSWATRVRNWAMSRWVLSLGGGGRAEGKEGKGKGRGAAWVSWDLRGNRGMISLFLALATYDFLACWVDTGAPKDPTLYAMPKHRLIANRAGNLCFAQLPLIMLLVTRRNAISYLTGTSLQDLLWFHRWVGWLTFLLGLVHIVIYGSYCVDPTDNFAYLRGALAKPYYVWGIGAAAAFVVIVLGSLKWVRTRWHEVFLVSHVLGSVAFFVSCFFHWKPRYIWPLLTILIYASTRIHRILLLIHHHVVAPLEARLRIDPAASIGSVLASMGPAEAVVEVLDERAMRIEVAMPEGVRWEAGQWVMLSFVGKGLGRGEWHPFSIASIPSPLPTSATSSSFSSSPSSFRSPNSLPSRSPPTTPETLPLLSAPTSPPPSLYTTPDRPISYPPPLFPHPTPLTNLSSPSSSLERNTMSFIVTPHSSLTRRLYDLALSHQEGGGQDMLLRTPVLVEGPYGVPPDLREAETVVLVAGGTGVAFVSAVWRRLLEASGEARKVVVVWSVREKHHLSWIPLPHLLALSLANPALGITTHFHYTNAPSPSSLKPPQPTTTPSTHGRPGLSAIIQSASDDAEGRVQVLVCGPASLSDAVVDVCAGVCDWRRVARGDEGGDVRVEVELFD